MWTSGGEPGEQQTNEKGKRKGFQSWIKKSVWTEKKRCRKKKKKKHQKKKGKKKTRRRKKKKNKKKKKKKKKTSQGCITGFHSIFSERKTVNFGGN